MHRRLAVCLALAAAALTLWTSAEAQYGPGGPAPFNPYTGRQAPGPRQPPNPFTGPGQPFGGTNPLTGVPAPVQVPLNPFTGQPMPGPGPVNPFTGQPTTGGPGRPAASAVPWPSDKLPLRGKAAPGLEPLDKAVALMMDRHGVPGAALAVAKDGKLIYAKGFGWSDLEAGTPVDPLTVFGLASLSKPITALAILLLIEQGKLGLDDPVFLLLKDIEPPRGYRYEPALKKVTVRHLLTHSGGWDRDKSGDPGSWEPQIARSLGVPQPVSDRQLVSYMLSVPLDFEPGTQARYSNFGYVVLGLVVEKVSGQPYEQFVRENILGPAGMKSAFLSAYGRKYRAGEARSYLAGTSVLLPPMQLPMIRAAGGWNANAVDMVRFLTAVDGSRGKGLLKDETFKLMVAEPKAPLRPKADGSHPGLGWPTVNPSPKGPGYLHDGNYHGMRTFMKRSPRGVNWALLFNVSMQPDRADDRLVADAVREIHEHLERHPVPADYDLFSEYR
jgi:N-acyl-D-amino-acid deacylase